VNSRAGTTHSSGRAAEGCTAARASERPLAWGLLGARAGDNRQVEQLVEALGYPHELQRLSFGPLNHLPNFIVGASFATVRRRESASLQPPWPDVVVSAGQRAVPVACWIRKRSGGRSRLVQLGRPRAALSAFDLVVTTPQYGLPADARVLANTLPFQRPTSPDPKLLETWRDAFAALPRPWIALLVGGETWPLRFSARVATELGRRASAAAAARGGSLLVTTSPRTGAAETEALLRALDGPSFRNDWRSDRPGCYASILALADAFIVTADSISMLAEVSRSGKPVEIYPLERRGGPWVWLADRWSVGTPEPGTVSAMLAILARAGILTPPRDLRRVASALIACGAAVPFSAETAPQPGNSGLLRSEMDNTVARIRELVEAERC